MIFSIITFYFSRYRYNLDYNLNLKTTNMKARILKGGNEVILSGEIIEFYLGKKVWSLLLKGSKVVQEHPDLFEVIMNGTKKLKGGDSREEPVSKAEINGNTVWLGFRFDSGVRVQIFNESGERI
jgi:hypothetical protein